MQMALHFKLFTSRGLDNMSCLLQCKQSLKLSSNKDTEGARGLKKTSNLFTGCKPSGLV